MRPQFITQELKTGLRISVLFGVFMFIQNLFSLHDVIMPPVPPNSFAQKGSATVLNTVNDRSEKRFSNSNFGQCVDRDVGLFEAWVSVFDAGLNRDYRLSLLGLAGETECGTVPLHPMTCTIAISSAANISTRAIAATLPQQINQSQNPISRSYYRIKPNRQV